MPQAAPIIESDIPSPIPHAAQAYGEVEARISHNAANGGNTVPHNTGKTPKMTTTPIMTYFAVCTTTAIASSGGRRAGAGRTSAYTGM